MQRQATSGRVNPMPYSESLAQRIRWQLTERGDVVEKKMFGGICFMLDGNICVGVSGDSLIARVGPGRYKTDLQKEFVGEFGATGRPMTGWVLIDPEGVDEDRQLRQWIQRALEFTETLPPK